MPDPLSYLQSYQDAERYIPELHGLDLSRHATRSARQKAIEDWIEKQKLNKYLLEGVAPGEFGAWQVGGGTPRSFFTSTDYGAEHWRAPDYTTDIEDPNPYIQRQRTSTYTPHIVAGGAHGRVKGFTTAVTPQYRLQNVMTQTPDRPGTSQAYWQQYKARKPLSPTTPTGAGRNRAYVDYLRRAQY